MVITIILPHFDGLLEEISIECLELHSISQRIFNLIFSGNPFIYDISNTF